MRLSLRNEERFTYIFLGAHKNRDTSVLHARTVCSGSAMAFFVCGDTKQNKKRKRKKRAAPHPLRKTKTKGPQLVLSPGRPAHARQKET